MVLLAKFSEIFLQNFLLYFVNEFTNEIDEILFFVRNFVMFLSVIFFSCIFQLSLVNFKIYEIVMCNNFASENYALCIVFATFSQKNVYS